VPVRLQDNSNEGCPDRAYGTPGPLLRRARLALAVALTGVCLMVATATARDRAADIGLPIEPVDLRLMHEWDTAVPSPAVGKIDVAYAMPARSATPADGGANVHSVASSSARGWFVEGGAAGAPAVAQTDDAAVGLQGQRRAIGYRSDAWNAAFKIGPQSIGMSNLIMTDVERPGVAANSSFLNGALDTHLFALGDAGADDTAAGSLLGQGTDQVRGVAATFRPLQRRYGEAAVSALYYSGRDEAADNTVQARGQGWGVNLDSSWLDRRFDLDTEFSSTSYQEKGISAADARSTAHGMAVRGGVDVVRQSDFAQAPFTLRVDGGWEWLDDGFASLVNDANGDDRERLYTDVTLDAGPLSGRLSVGRTRNNVADDLAAPTDRTADFDVEMGYALGDSVSDLVMRFVDLPRGMSTTELFWGRKVSRSGRVHSPDATEPEQPQETKRQHFVGLRFGTRSLSTELRHERVGLIDGAAGSNSTETSNTDLSAEWAVNRRLSLSLSGGVSSTAGAVADDLDAGLGLKAQIILDRLAISFDYGVDVDAPAARLDEYRLSGEIDWQVVRPNGRRAGVALSFRGSGDRDRANASGHYEIFAALKLSPPRPSR